MLKERKILNSKESSFIGSFITDGYADDLEVQIIDDPREKM